MAPTVFASLSSYVLGRVLGHKHAEHVLTEQVRLGPQQDVDGIMPGSITLHRIATQHDVALRVDGGATCIGKSRSRHFHAALESGRDVWVTCDDDVEATERTTRWLVEAVAGTDEPRVCVVPCIVRGSERKQATVAVDWATVYYERRLSNGGLVRRARRGGFGLVAMNRAALQAVALACPTFIDDDGTRKPAPFIELVDEGSRWLGEDLAFFARLPGGVVVEGLYTGETTHAGLALDLSDSDGRAVPAENPLTRTP